jgi:hypothetical protein
MKTVMMALLLGAAAGAGPTMVAEVSSPKNDYNLTYGAAEKTMVFARSDADFKNARIYVATKVGGRWSVPAAIAFSDPAFSDSDPWLTPDGQWLYFVSDRPAQGREADRKDMDLWRARRTRSGWSAPEHLAAQSSRNPELGPELHGGRLYFNTVRKGGKGGLDIYVADPAAGGFGEPRPIEGPFNTGTSESDFTLSPDGRRAAFWRMVGERGLIHTAERGSDGAWSAPKPLPDNINIGPFNFTSHFGRDGRTLRFASTRARDGQAAGMADIYVVKLARNLK